MKQTQKESSNMGMKRSRELDMATCLMLLSRVSESAKSIKRFSTDSDRVFTCKTCDREFSSFQALGGHRASHKKPRVAEGEAVKTKTHECSICGLEFAIGQALGGHMRKHRNAAVSTESSDQDQDPAPVAVMNRCSSKRVVCLDLNLTPLENDLKLHLGLML